MSGPASLSRPELEELAEHHINEYFPGYTARRRRRDGIGVVLDWLEGAEGSSWQERWEKLGETSADWLTDVGATTRRQRTEARVALQTLILERVIRPSYTWLLEGRHHFLYRNMRSTLHKEAFDAILAGTPKTGASGATVKQATVTRKMSVRAGSVIMVFLFMVISLVECWCAPKTAGRTETRLRTVPTASVENR